MSKNSNSRSQNVSPITGKQGFLSFLEPSPRIHESSDACSARAQSPKLAKNQTSSRASPIKSSKLIFAKLELSQKHNAILQERNKTLAKEKQLLKSKLNKHASNPRDKFIAQAISLTKESYLKRIAQKNSRKISEFEEKIPAIRKILKWINEQDINTQIKFIKPGINEILDKIKGFEIEIEANNACLLKQCEEKIKEKILEQNYQNFGISKNIIAELVTKNTELSRQICDLETQIQTQNVKYI
jgi:hypothetical protein